MTGWATALRKVTERLNPAFTRPIFRLKDLDWERVVVIDFETYYDLDYTLSKLSTSEYVRDPRFKAQMMYLKVGTKPAKIYGPKQIAAALRRINWATHSLLCHHTQFDGLILSHHYGIVPTYYLDSLSMARGLHSNEIGAGLEEVSIYYGGTGKVKDVLETTKGVLNWSKALFDSVTTYCMQDGDETLRVFTEMFYHMPADEMDLVDKIVRMFCDPVLRLDIPRVEKELARELAERERVLTTIIPTAPHYGDKTVLKSTVERALVGVDRDVLITKRIIGSNEKFASLLRTVGVEPPVKLSKSWMKRSPAEREATKEDKWSYAFAKDDIDFVNLPDTMERWTAKYDLESVNGVKAMAEQSAILRGLVEARIMVKSTTNITRAQRFLSATANDWSLPAYYAYSRAHTHRLGGGDKRNPQNLVRGGELRLSIEAPAGYELVVGDSGQIEARVNGWLWGQDDLLDAFRTADKWDKKRGVAHGNDRDAYCRFADALYGREITTEDKTERFVGKVCVLGLGFQMGAPKLQTTLAKGALGGPPVFISLEESKRWVSTYRRKNNKIEGGWRICARIIEDMASGQTGAHGPISWEAGKVWLPNGLCLQYPDLKKDVNDDGWDEWTYRSGDTRKKIYGGLLCENIVQALARIIVMTQLLWIARVDRVVLTTHDEIVTCVKKPAAPLAFHRMMKAMTTPLEWCMDLPLAAEGGHAHNYSK